MGTVHRQIVVNRLRRQGAEHPAYRSQNDQQMAIPGMMLGGKDAMPGGIGRPLTNQDWPVPKGPVRLRPTEYSNNQNAVELPLLGKDAMPGGVGAPLTNFDWPNPQRPRRPPADFLHSYPAWQPSFLSLLARGFIVSTGTASAAGKTSLAARAASMLSGRGAGIGGISLAGLASAAGVRARLAAAAIGIALSGRAVGALTGQTSAVGRSALNATGRALAFGRATATNTAGMVGATIAALRGRLAPPTGTTALSGRTIGAMFGRLVKPGAIVLFGSAFVKLYARAGFLGTLPLSGTLKITAQARANITFVQYLKGASASALQATASMQRLIALAAATAGRAFGRGTTVSATRLTGATSSASYARSSLAGITALRGATRASLVAMAGAVFSIRLAARATIGSFGSAMFARLATLSGRTISRLTARSAFGTQMIALSGRSLSALRAFAGIVEQFASLGYARFLTGMAARANIIGTPTRVAVKASKSTATIVGSTSMTTHLPLDFVSGDNWVLTGPLQDGAGNPLNLVGATITWKLDRTDPITGIVTNQLTLALGSGITVTGLASATILVELSAVQTALIPGGTYSDWLRVVLATGEVFTEWTGAIRVAPNPT